MSQKQAVLEMLVNGIPPTAIASSLGVSESYISQLANDEQFKEELSEKRIAVAQHDLDYDKKLDTAEEDALDILKNKLRFANLQQSVGVFSALNKARRRRESGNHAPQAGMGTVVNITIPVTVLPQYVQNSLAEIVEVDGKTMVSTNPKALDAIIAQRQAEGKSLTAPVAPGVTRVARANGVLEQLDNKPTRRLNKRTTDSELVDML